MPRVHDNELDIDEALVRALLGEQFPDWAALPLERQPEGTVHVIYRLGADLSVRLPRREGPEVEDDLETRWLPVLAPQLPVAIPRPVARGKPGAGYPWYWSIHTWVAGDAPAGDLSADDIASFLAALRRIDTTDGPEPSGGRGKLLAWRDESVRDALARVDAPGAAELWDEAMHAPQWERLRVWIHCDLDRRNVVARGGRLTGVFDWGGVGIGDPAVDDSVAWKLVAREDRDRLRELLEADDATWLRARGWVLSQALIALGYYTPENNPAIHAEATRWLAEVLAS
jgi:aminoglycoside phosphotransferase (APT) family kinase protein